MQQITVDKTDWLDANSKFFSKTVNFLLILGLFVLLPVTAVELLVHYDVTPEALFGVGAMLGIWSFVVSALLLGQPLIYILFCIGLSVVLIVKFFREKAIWRKVAMLFLLSMLSAFALSPYWPSVRPAHGYEMIVSTQPSPLLRGLKRAQALGEVYTCNYHILGWQDQSVVYEQTCGDYSTVWQFNPTHMNAAFQYDGQLANSLSGQAVWRDNVRQYFRAHGVYPQAAAESVRDLAIKEQASLSPDKQWLAVVVRYIYGPEDVVLIRKETGCCIEF